MILKTRLDSIELLRTRNNADRRKKFKKSPSLPPTTTSNVSQSSITFCSNTTPKNVTASVAQWTLAHHERYIVDSIQRWCNDNKENLNLNDFTLIDGQQYRLAVKNYLNGTLTADINCDCGNLFILTKSRGKFQLSNYYRHLKAVKSYKVMKEIKNNDKSLTLSINTQSPSIDLSPTPPILSASISSLLTSSSVDHTNSQHNVSTSSITYSGSARAKRRINSTESGSASSLTKKRRTHQDFLYDCHPVGSLGVKWSQVESSGVS
ncbi:unnamed protein product [Didymodactylos carnosus]|uniref:Uncharacterized protein n=1 Tax=Didymodactylos carnosus TaxID=1234261 RepID=A0A815DGK2_9BILA|nr:unnamed protein product [Didymodactylos carnosus]CAF1298035.1 unnamed protein product [Didymodactylos carnosus]CAF4031714.1 unnamed protein product [Didymodactylos carnosus]CAF4116073.1 unnamed protein product [Didymodactylos carnosus]